ncbi:MAG TPA: zf-HC2 domain-containing protein [Solirubrobacteraceae bacterium]|jgi:anti-sigma factor RsiW
MNCDEMHPLISAALDGELPAADLAALSEHLEDCEPCRDWQLRAQALARLTRLGPAEEVPGPNQAWKRSVVAAAPRRRVSSRSLQVALVAIATLQLAVTLPLLVSGRTDAVRDQGAVGVAAAFGLFVVAACPWRAAGFQTFLGAAALLLIGTELVDLARGDGALLDLARHSLVLASWCAVRLMARAAPPAPPATHGTTVADLRRLVPLPLRGGVVTLRLANLVAIAVVGAVLVGLIAPVDTRGESAAAAACLSTAASYDGLPAYVDNSETLARCERNFGLGIQPAIL